MAKYIYYKILLNSFNILSQIYFRFVSGLATTLIDIYICIYYNRLEIKNKFYNFFFMQELEHFDYISSYLFYVKFESNPLK